MSLHVNTPPLQGEVKQDTAAFLRDFQDEGFTASHFSHLRQAIIRACQAAWGVTTVATVYLPLGWGGASDPLRQQAAIRATAFHHRELFIIGWDGQVQQEGVGLFCNLHDYDASAEA